MQALGLRAILLRHGGLAAFGGIGADSAVVVRGDFPTTERTRFLRRSVLESTFLRGHSQDVLDESCLLRFAFTDYRRLGRDARAWGCCTRIAQHVVDGTILRRPLPFKQFGPAPAHSVNAPLVVATASPMMRHRQLCRDVLHGAQRAWLDGLDRAAGTGASPTCNCPSPAGHAAPHPRLRRRPPRPAGLSARSSAGDSWPTARTDDWAEAPHRDTLLQHAIEACSPHRLPTAICCGNLPHAAGAVYGIAARARPADFRGYLGRGLRCLPPDFRRRYYPALHHGRAALTAWIGQQAARLP